MKVQLQNKLTYSSLGKAFEKQIQTIENQVENKIRAYKEHGKQLLGPNGPFETKQNFDRAITERLDKPTN